MGPMSGFDGFGPEVHGFFTGLEADNSKAFFDLRRAFFDAEVRGQMEAMLETLAEDFGGEVKLFRQNRDTRFSPDKSPYKTNTYGVLRGAPQAAQGLYASISARGLVAGSGYHVMARDQLERYRIAVDRERDGDELGRRTAAAQAAGLELWGESLATAPRGYDREHPRIELLRRKSLSLGALRPCADGIGSGDALAFVSGTWRAAAPVTGWLDEHVGLSAEPPPTRGRGRR